ncbi:MAG TPA: hypothetical protein VEC57_16635 [Candidatus Limnocylindrales bacterium]|nr:hypothetical protein [Candidatus Limnocylindrales bacterium]
MLIRLLGSTPRRLLWLLVAFTASAAPSAGIADEAARQAGMVAAMRPAERSEQDRARDAQERPQAIAQFAGLRQGMHIADLHAGDGYVTEVLMGSVIPYGKIFANNDPSLLSPEQTQAWKKRLESPDTADLAELDNAVTQALPYYAKGLQAVFSIGVHHKMVIKGIDRAAVHRVVFDALAPGGLYIVADARAAKGSDAAKAAAACRSHADALRAEVEAAGFRFLEQSDALANSKDARTSDACSSKDMPDRFLMKFERPSL